MRGYLFPEEIEGKRTLCPRCAEPYADKRQLAELGGVGGDFSAVVCEFCTQEMEDEQTFYGHIASGADWPVRNDRVVSIPWTKDGSRRALIIEGRRRLLAAWEAGEFTIEAYSVVGVEDVTGQKIEWEDTPKRGKTTLLGPFAAWIGHLIGDEAWLGWYAEEQARVEAGIVTTEEERRASWDAWQRSFEGVS